MWQWKLWILFIVLRSDAQQPRSFPDVDNALSFKLFYHINNLLIQIEKKHDALDFSNQSCLNSQLRFKGFIAPANEEKFSLLQTTQKQFQSLSQLFRSTCQNKTLVKLNHIQPRSPRRGRQPRCRNEEWWEYEGNEFLPRCKKRPPRRQRPSESCGIYCLPPPTFFIPEYIPFPVPVPAPPPPPPPRPPPTPSKYPPFPHSNPTNPTKVPRPPAPDPTPLPLPPTLPPYGNSSLCGNANCSVAMPGSHPCLRPSYQCQPPPGFPCNPYPSYPCQQPWNIPPRRP